MSELEQHLNRIYTPAERRKAEADLDNLPLEGIESFLEICGMVETHELTSQGKHLNVV